MHCQMDDFSTESAEKLPIAIYVCQDGRFRWANSRFLKNTGYLADEIQGALCLSLVHPDDRESVRNNAIAMLRGESLSPYEFRVIAKDGHTLWVMESLQSFTLRGKRAFVGSQMDISKQKHAEEVSQEKQRRIEEAYRLAHLGSWSWTKDTGVLTWSDEVYEMLGLDPAHPLSIEEFSRLYAPGYFKRRMKANQQAMETGKSYEMETSMIHADGTRRWLNTFCAAKYDADGKIIGLHGTVQDITDRKQAEEAIRISEDRYRSIIDTIADAYYEIDLAGNLRMFNDAFLKLNEYTREEMTGLNVKDYRSKENLADGLKIFKQVYKTGVPVSHMDWEVITRSGKRIQEEFSVSLIRDAEGKPAGFRGIVRDVTERRQMEAALRISEERYRTIVESIPDPYSEIDLTGTITYVNQAFLNESGYSREELLGLNFRVLLDDRNIDLATQVYRGVFKTGRAVKNLELEWKAKNGQVKLSEVSVNPRWDIDGKAMGFQSIYHDVTERRQMEAALCRAKEVAEAASNAKSEFLASMSHEIRTPMNAILGMAELLIETPLTREQMKYVQVFREAGENLLNIINDILDLSKVEAGHIHLEHIAFDLRELVERIGDIMSVRASKKELELTCHIAPDVPTYLQGDPIRLRQVIVNLLGNAIKFTEQGEVLLDVTPTPQSAEGDGGDTMDLTFSICDTGIGIPPEKVKDVFDRFTQADSSTTRKYGGTGLGLTISKSLVELMGGTIQVKSDVGKGSVFSFTIPLARLKGPVIEEEPLFADIAGCRALIIDDNATNRLILREMLTGWGAIVTSVDNGLSGISSLKEAQTSNNPYDFIILDYHMPFMDGFTTAKEIRKDTGLTSTAIIMVSSGYPEENLTEAKNIGIDQFLYKPVKRRDLREAISAALGKVQMAETKPVVESGAADTRQPLKILLVEDNEDNRLLIGTFLKSTPYRLQMAENGAVGVELFKAGTYDIVLMDMQMPVMDGYEATREIRRWEQSAGRPAVPIIALTAYALKEDEQKSLDAGCDGHLTKPIKKANLLSALVDYSKRNP